VAAPALAQTAETPSGHVPAEPRVAVEAGGDWTGDDWLSPSGVSYQVGGWVSRLGLSAQGEWNGRIDARLTTTRTPIFRTDSQEDVTRWGQRLLVTWSQSRFQQKRVEGDYQIDAGIGLIGDVQMHQGGVPRARARDYLDETQVRVGPVLRGDITWFHPTDPAWRVYLTVLGLPRLLGLTTGNVAYPTGWSGIEAAIGPSYRWQSLELRTGIEGRIWAGGAFIQRAGGFYLQGSYRF
jgi:hypothetical protein